MKAGQQFQRVVSKVGADVLKGYLRLDVQALEQSEISSRVMNKEVSVIIQMIGQLEGQVIFSMEKTTAKQIVGSMMGGMVVEELDELAWSAIREFANWFASGMATEFSNQGYDINITHPIVSEGCSILHSDQSYTVVPLLSACGTIDIFSSIELQEAS